MIPFLTTLFLLIFGHCLADYPLQGQFLAEGKNRHTKLGKIYWPYCLSSHAIIHGGFVFLVTTNLILAFAEIIIHAITDWLKCEQKISMFQDQVIHYTCKLLWAYLAVYVLI